MFTRARLVLAGWFTLALVATLVLVGATAYVLIRRDIEREIDDSLRTTLRVLGDRRPVRPGTVIRGQGVGQDDPFRLPAGIPSDVFVVYTDTSGEVLANPRSVDIETVDFERLCEEAAAAEGPAQAGAEGNYRFLTQQVRRDTDLWVHVGRSLEARDRQLRTLSTVFAVGGLGGVVASAAGGVWLAGRAMKPIRVSFDRQRQFVSDASHELRTPLAVVRANSEILQMNPDQTVGANMDQVDAITAEAEAMTRLVEDLLTLARADEGGGNLERARVALGALVEELGRDMAAVAASRQIELRVEAEPVEVMGDRRRLRQLGAILLDNALKYTPEGGSVRVACSRAGRNVELSVSDTGPGIPAEERSRVFDRFVRLDSARTRATGGAGLGLAIARWVAEAHGGRIWVEAAPGGGSRFVVRLPAANPAAD